MTVLKEAGLNYGALPLLFVRNEGQFEPEVRYCAQAKDSDAYSRRSE